MTDDLAEALLRANKLRDPTPADLGLPDNALALYALEDSSTYAAARGGMGVTSCDRAVPAEQKKQVSRGAPASRYTRGSRCRQ